MEAANFPTVLKLGNPNVPKNYRYLRCLANGSIAPCGLLKYDPVQIVRSFSVYFPPPPKKNSDLRESHDPIWLGLGGHVPTPIHAYTLLKEKKHVYFENICGLR